MTDEEYQKEFDARKRTTNTSASPQQ